MGGVWGMGESLSGSVGRSSVGRSMGASMGAGAGPARGRTPRSPVGTGSGAWNPWRIRTPIPARV